MVYNIQLIRHDKISEEQVFRICDFKAIRWDYSLEEHRIWIMKNLNPDDSHILIMEGEMLVAYANLVDTSAMINGKMCNVKGVGNVCTRASGKGYGSILMETINFTFKKK